MKNLADYIHGRGLKFGVYTARCRFTCQLFAASFGHEAVDARQWARPSNGTRECLPSHFFLFQGNILLPFKCYKRL